jgi:hypothetical protein
MWCHIRPPKNNVKRYGIKVAFKALTPSKDLRRSRKNDT